MLTKHDNKVLISWKSEDILFDTTHRMPYEVFEEMVKSRIVIYALLLKSRQEYKLQWDLPKVFWHADPAVIKELNEYIPVNLVECYIEDNVDLICNLNTAIVPEAYYIYVKLPTAITPGETKNLYNMTWRYLHLRPNASKIKEDIILKIKKAYAELFSYGVINVQDGEVLKNYYELANTKPVLFNFSSSTCGPCNAIAEDLNRFAEEITDNVVTVKIKCGSTDPIKNGDFVDEMSRKYAIRGLPSFILKEGNTVSKWVGGGSTYNEMKRDIRAKIAKGKTGVLK